MPQSVRSLPTDLAAVAALLSDPKTVGEWLDNVGPFALMKAQVPVGFLPLRVVEVNKEGEEVKHLYTHLFRAEAAGGLFLPVNKDGKVGLQRRWRFQVQNMGEWNSHFTKFGGLLRASLTKAFGEVEAFRSLKRSGAGQILESEISVIGKSEDHRSELADLIRRCATEAFDGLALKVTGRWSYEAPRGYGNLGKTGEETSVEEAGQETGRVIITAQSLPDLCDNTAQSPHLVTARVGILGRKVADTDPDPGQPGKLPDVEWLSLVQLAALTAKGELYCALTLAAIQHYTLASVAEPTRYPPLQ